MSRLHLTGTGGLLLLGNVRRSGNRLGDRLSRGGADWRDLGSPARCLGFCVMRKKTSKLEIGYDAMGAVKATNDEKGQGSRKCVD